jgi:hypothetical protein
LENGEKSCFDSCRNLGMLFRENIWVIIGRLEPALIKYLQHGSKEPRQHNHVDQRIPFEVTLRVLRHKIALDKNLEGDFILRVAISSHTQAQGIFRYPNGLQRYFCSINREAVGGFSCNFTKVSRQVVSILRVAIFNTTDSFCIDIHNIIHRET